MGNLIVRGNAAAMSIVRGNAAAGGGLNLVGSRLVAWGNVSIQGNEVAGGGARPKLLNYPPTLMSSMYLNRVALLHLFKSIDSTLNSSIPPLTLFF